MPKAEQLINSYEKGLGEGNEVYFEIARVYLRDLKTRYDCVSSGIVTHAVSIKQLKIQFEKNKKRELRLKRELRFRLQTDKPEKTRSQVFGGAIRSIYKRYGLKEGADYDVVPCNSTTSFRLHAPKEIVGEMLRYEGLLDLTTSDGQQVSMA